MLKLTSSRFRFGLSKKAALFHSLYSSFFICSSFFLPSFKLKLLKITKPRISSMAVNLVVGFLILAMAGHSSAAFCVCKPGVNPGMMQKAIDYACGAGADCNPIRPNGQCYNPNNIVNHCSYAVNSYYQKNAAKGATCVFDGTATLSNQDPSGGGCSYSATGSTSSSTTTTVPTTSPGTPTSTPVTGGVTPVSGSGGTPMSGAGGGTPMSGAGGGTPVSGTGMNPTTASPYTASPNTGSGVLGGGVGVGTGMAPTGSYDDSHGGIKLQSMSLGSNLMTVAIFMTMITWN